MFSWSLCGFPVQWFSGFLVNPKKHVSRLTDYAQLPLSVKRAELYPRCTQNRLQIEH